MSAGNVSNFKGVMLCNRPPEPSPAMFQSSADQGEYGGGRSPFVSTVLPPDQLGLNPIKKDFPAVVKKDETEDVTWRAKRWLAEFQERQSDLCAMLEQAAIEKEKKQARFREKQAQMRATIRNVRETDPNNREAMAAALDMDGDVAPAEVAKTMKMKKKPNKPKWAMTAEQNEDAELDEVDDLLNFTDNLDFDQYIGDLEVKEALNFVKTRVENLQNGDAKDPDEEDEEYEGDELEGEEDDEFTTLADMEGQKEMKKRARRARKRRDEDGASVYSEGAESVMSTTSTVSRAHALLSNNTKMKAVHSQASVTAMMEREKQQLAGGGNYAVQPPIVATTKDRNSADFDPANLPYLNRSPQV